MVEKRIHERTHVSLSRLLPTLLVGAAKTAAASWDCQVGRLHHIVKRFSGRELLVQMLVATAEERQFALLYDLQEVQMQPPRTVMNDQCWNIVDAVLFFLNLREAERKRAAPEECAPRGSKRTLR